MITANIAKTLIGATACGLLSLSHAAAALNIALSNDDGWNAIGIQTVKQALVAAGHTVVLAAPLNEQSGSSAAFNTGGLIITKKREGANFTEFSVATTAGEGAEPATSALLAISIAGEPDLLVMGTNDGANIGSFTQVSGTVGGVIVGLSSTFNKAVPSIAISTDPICDTETPQCVEENAVHFASVAGFLADFIAYLETKPGFLSKEPGLLPPGIGLNINYPPTTAPLGVKYSIQGMTAALGGATSTLLFGCFGDCAGAAIDQPTVGGISGITPDSSTEQKNADTVNFAQGYITVVPIEGDYTAGDAKRYKKIINKFNKFNN